MHISLHAIFSFLAGLIISLNFKGEVSWLFILIFVLAGIIMDIDHFFYFRIRYGKKWYKKTIEDFKGKRHHFYPSHTIEFLILTGILVYFYKPLIFIWLAFVLHLFLDFLIHITPYAGYSWLKYYSLIYYFLT